MRGLRIYRGVFTSLLLLLVGFCLAGVDGQAGPYRLNMSAQPQVIPVGKAKLIFKVSDASGQPVQGLDLRAIARMPGMFMGEREQKALANASQPGEYAMDAAFPMAGAYEVAVKISGSLGPASAVLNVKTGQNIGADAASFSYLSLLPWVIGLALVVFIFVRMRASGQRIDGKALVNRGTISGVLLLIAMLAIATYAVNNFRRQGAMTPLEAQVMEMNTPAPPGSTAVQLATVTRGSLSATVRYTGQAVGFVEQDVVARGTGVIVWMPVYVGDTVKKGQILARLDTSQLDPQLAERAAMTNMAAQGVGVAATEYQTALQEVAEARADVSAKVSMVAEAEAMLMAAKQEKEAMVAEVEAMRSDVASAEAEVSASRETARFRTDELGRMRQLFAQNAVSRSELQEAEAEAAEAQSKLRQAESMVRQTTSKVKAAEANVRKADAMISAAQKRIRQAQADVRAAEAAVRSRQSGAEAAKKNIAKERAGVAQAQAGYQSAAAQRGYAALKAEVDGVVTQRLISPGVLVNPGQAVLKVAQVAPIRLQANVPEGDLAKISVGASVTLKSRDGKGEPVIARVSSVSPAVDPQARTGVVEVVWPNTTGRFLPGQFVTMEIETSLPSEGLTVPSEAVQSAVNSKPFVWVAESSGDPGQFTVNRVEVEVGPSNGSLIQIKSGLTEGQQVVVAGGMYLKDGGAVSAPTETSEAKGPLVEIVESGYKPDVVEAEVGKPITITFIRRTEQTCGTEVVFPDFKINKPLPLNKPVEVTITPEKAGEFKFTCDMDMLLGKLVVR
jgi:RND family efflux transporter MFP subunit